MSRSLHDLLREGLFSALAGSIASSVVKGDVKSVRKALQDDPELQKAADELINSMLAMDKLAKKHGVKDIADIVRFKD